MKYVGSKYKKEFMSDLKQVYKAPTSERSDNSTGTRTKATAEEALL